MAFSDPQTITIDAIAKICNLVEPGTNKSVYATADEEIKLTISHQTTSKDRTRRMVRIDRRIVAADPLTSKNEYKTAGIYLVIDEPEYGFSDTDLDKVVQGFCAWLSSANVGKILSGQH